MHVGIINREDMLHRENSDERINLTYGNKRQDMFQFRKVEFLLKRNRDIYWQKMAHNTTLKEGDVSSEDTLSLTFIIT